jgi:hypothetical protein
MSVARIVGCGELATDTNVSFVRQLVLSVGTENYMDEFEGDLAGLTTWREVRESEDQLRAAVEKRRRLDEPDNWTATESIDKEGRKQLNFRNVHFELRELADQQVQRARAGVIATRRAWAGIDDGRGF